MSVRIRRLVALLAVSALPLAGLVACGEYENDDDDDQEQDDGGGFGGEEDDD